MDWATFTNRFKTAWKPGQHLVLIGPTGEGKTTFAVHILASRKFLLALDPKGDDETLSRLKLPTLTHWPPDQRVWNEIAEGKPARFRVGVPLRTGADWERLRQLFERTLNGVFECGGFTIYLDELQILTDPSMMRLRGPIDRLYVAARSKGVSAVSSYQAPAWVSPAASRQATWFVVFRTNNRDMLKKVADITGKDWHALEAAVQSMPEFHQLVISKKHDDPILVVSAPEV